jgi:hypothetical protein
MAMIVRPVQKLFTPLQKTVRPPLTHAGFKVSCEDSHVRNVRECYSIDWMLILYYVTLILSLCHSD